MCKREAHDHRFAQINLRFWAKKNPECGIPGVSIARGSQGRDSHSTRMQLRPFLSTNQVLFYISPSIILY